MCPEQHCALTGLDRPAAYNTHHIRSSPARVGRGAGVASCGGRVGICKALSLAKPPGAQVERLTIVSLPYDPGIDVKVCVGAVATEKSHQLLIK